MNTTYKNYLRNPSIHAFQFKSVDEETVFKTIDMLQSKLSCSIDDISVKLLKTIKVEIYKMIPTCIFPDKLNHAIVMPLNKKDDNTILNTYRPISILPAISKNLNTLSLINFMTTFILISYITAAKTASGNSTPLNLLPLN